MERKTPKKLKVYNQIARKRIVSACAKREITAIELNNKIGWKDRTIYNKMKSGKITRQEFEQIADGLGCKYVCRIILPNGQIIE